MGIRSWRLSAGMERIGTGVVSWGRGGWEEGTVESVQWTQWTMDSGEWSIESGQWRVRTKN